MIKKKANKLFWDKYLYKLGVYNSGTPIFRNKRLDQARDVLDKLNLQFIAGEPIQWSPTRFSQKSIEISQSDLDDLKILINVHDYIFINNIYILIIIKSLIIFNHEHSRTKT